MDQVGFISGRSRIYGIVGHPIEQVRSPEMITAEFFNHGRDAILIAIHVLPADAMACVPQLTRVQISTGRPGATACQPRRADVKRHINISIARPDWVTMPRARKPSTKPARPIEARQPMPLYHQIYLTLRDQIANGSYAHDDFLPTEQELIREYGVSRITAKRALDELKMDGLVVRSRGRGTRVQIGNRVPAVRAPIEGLVENILAMGLKTEVDLLEFDYVPADREVAAALGCAVGATVQRAVRIRRLHGEPFSHLVTHVPEAIGRTFSRRELATRPLLLLLERSGASVSHAEQIITAALASGPVAQLLNVPTGASLLRITRTVYDQDGRAVEHIVGSYRPDRYQYKMTLSRSSAGARKLWSAKDGSRRRRAPTAAWDN